MQQVKNLADLAQITERLDTHFIPQKITRKVIDSEKAVSQIPEEFSILLLNISCCQQKISSKSQNKYLHRILI